MCSKRAHASRAAARKATAKVRNRFRIYWCGECSAYHVTQLFDGDAHKVRTPRAPVKRPRRHTWTVDDDALT